MFYALKVIRKDYVLDDRTLDAIIKEKQILKESNDPYIVQMIQGF